MWKGSKSQFIYKLYDRSNNFIRVLNDVASPFEAEYTLYGGLGPLTLRFPKRIDELASDLVFNNRIKVFVRNKFHETPKLIYWGYIVSIDPIFREGREETGVTCLGNISKLQNDYLRSGNDLAFEIGPKVIGDHIKDIINNYLSHLANPSMISNDWSLISDTSGIGQIPYRYFNLKHLEAIKEITKFLPKDDAHGEFWIWYLNEEGKFVLKKLSTETDHALLLRKHIAEINLRKNIENLSNKIFFYNERGASSPEYVQMVLDDGESQNKYDVIASQITDTAVTHYSQAKLLCEGKLAELKDIQAEATVRVIGATFDIFSFKPGDLVKIRDIRSTELFPDRMMIRRIRWRGEEAELELSTPRPDITTQVEQDRKYVEEQLRWFGRVLTRVDGTRISSGALHWTSTGIKFTPATGADSYRKVEWTAGAFHLPNGVQRVITNGDTGVMDQNLYVYLDEKNKWTAKDKGETTPSESGTGTIAKGDDTLLDSSKNWTTDQWKGYVLIVNPGTNEERHIIRGNSQTTLQVETDDKFDLETGSYSYQIWKFALRTISDISNLSFEDQIVVLLARKQTNPSLRAEPIPFLSTVSDSANYDDQEASRRAREGLDESAHVIKVLKGCVLPTTIPSEAGLVMNQNFLGYKDAGTSPDTFRSYIGSDGTFYFNKGGENYIQWDGTKLMVRGDIYTTGGVMNADYITAGTLTGRTVRIEKSSYSDTAAGFWVGLDGNVAKLNLGDANTFFRWDGNKLNMRIASGKGDVTIQGTVGSLSLTEGGVLYKVGTCTNSGVFLGTGVCPVEDTSEVQLVIGVGSSETDVQFAFNRTGPGTGNFSKRVPSTISLGTSDRKWNALYVSSTYSCPLPTSYSAIDIFKQIKKPEILRGDYGERHYFRVSDFPAEMKDKNDKGEDDIELIRTLGVTVQAVRELIEKVETLEQKLKNISI